MSFDYAKTAATSLALITNFGRDVTRRTYTAGTYDTATGVVAPATADTTRKGVVLPFKAGQSMVNGSLIQAGDVQLLLDAAASVALTDHYVIGAVEYVTISFEPLSPAGTVVLNTLHLRVM